MKLKKLFILLMVGRHPDQFMNKVQEEVNNKIHIEQKTAVFGLSWGYVNLPLANIKDIESVYQEADRTLYIQKHKG
jgi:GGDEF domain-containing protein